MPFNKVSGLVNLPAQMLPISLAAGEVFMVPPGQGLQGQFGAISTPQLGSNNTLSGQYLVHCGQYSVLQIFDYGLQYWRTVNATPWGLYIVSGDGANYRIANSTGCPVAGLITAAGSAGTNGFYGYNAQGQAITIVNGVTTLGNTVFNIVPSAGGSLWNAIVGGACTTTMSFAGTVYNGNFGVNNAFAATVGGVTASAGSNYQRAPMIIFSPPPNQGAQPYCLPCATCTISGGAINAITVTQQGAGLLGLPGVTVVPAPGDTQGGGAVIGWTSPTNNAMVGTGTVTLVWPAFYGTAVAAAPTFTYTGSSNPSPTITSIMNWTIASITNTTPGAGYTNAFGVVAGGLVAGNAVLTNPAYDKAVSVPIYPPLIVAGTTGVTTLGPFGGVNLQAAVTLAFGTQLAAGTVTTVAVQTPVMGGANDTAFIMSL
jgi:hypothetical protein